MNKHKLILVGGTDQELRVPAELLAESIAALLEGAQRATRFFVDGDSLRKGPRPAWLEAACAIDVTGLSEGSARLSIEAPTLAEADSRRFGDEEQASLFSDAESDTVNDWSDSTAVDLFGRALQSVLEGAADDVLADRDLLNSCIRFANIPSGGFRRVRLEGVDRGNRALELGPDDVPRIELLRDELPPPEAARVSGILDTISASRREVTMTLRGGVKIPARIENHDPETLKALFGTKVTASGLAHFRPSGSLLRLEIENIEEAKEHDRIFEAAPRARRSTPLIPSSLSQDAKSGVPAFFGTWPGDESEEELLEAVRAISGSRLAPNRAEQSS